METVGIIMAVIFGITVLSVFSDEIVEIINAIRGK